MIRYALHPFPLAPAAAPGQSRPYQARVRSRGTISADELLDRMVERGMPGGRAAGVAVLQTFFATAQDILLEGYNLVTPLFTTELSIKGTFTGPDDQFRANRHQLGFKAAAGSALTHALRHDARVQKEGADTPAPHPHHLHDFATERADVLTLGGVARLTGDRLKLGALPDEGLFLDLPDGTSVVVTALFTNQAGELLFRVPETGLEPGTTVRLRVRARMHNAATPRDGSFQHPLLILAAVEI
ncbi:MAG: DUF4469 domain-containing protein [Hymenobacteraceae bacterium]|nr:DUF4469 domain-containing protein [Hymenobacteraceae bacterium]